MDDEERNAQFRKRMENMLADAAAAGELGEDARMSGPWLFIGEAYADDGSRLISTFTNEDNRLTEALGLVEFAKVIYVEGARRWCREGGEE